MLSLLPSMRVFVRPRHCARRCDFDFHNTLGIWLAELLFSARNTQMYLFTKHFTTKTCHKIYVTVIAQTDS
jgi:uncharacterized iron-regulated membrane protein